MTARTLTQTAADDRAELAGEHQDLQSVPLEWLETELTSMAARIAAATAQWLGWLAAYDSRDGYTTWGCRSAAHWLNWKCAMSLKTAHEHVRVANALQNLPVIRAAFAEGKLSYSKVRAMTRVADIDNEQSLCDVALCSTASQLEAVCAAFRIATSDLTETQSAAAAFAKRRVTSRNNHDGTATIVIVVPVDTAMLIAESIDSRVDTIIEDATGVLTRRELVAQRRALTKRDRNGCQFPGCGTTRGLHAHHVVHWANGGPTELDNLILLCSFHHHIVHEGGWNITRTCTRGRFQFHNTQGEPVGVEVFRGRLIPLTGSDPDNPDIINHQSGETIHDMAWLITVICHNDTVHKTRASLN